MASLRYLFCFHSSNGLGLTIWHALDNDSLNVLDKEIWKHLEHQSVLSFYEGQQPNPACIVSHRRLSVGLPILPFISQSVCQMTAASLATRTWPAYALSNRPNLNCLLWNCEKVKARGLVWAVNTDEHLVDLAESGNQDSCPGFVS